MLPQIECARHQTQDSFALCFIGHTHAAHPQTNEIPRTLTPSAFRHMLHTSKRHWLLIGYLPGRFLGRQSWSFIIVPLRYVSGYTLVGHLLLF